MMTKKDLEMDLVKNSSEWLAGLPKGKKNMYRCVDCAHTIITLDLDSGVTPFIVLCRSKSGCEGLMQSTMYPEKIQEWPNLYEWFRPESDDSMNHGARSHYLNGGLTLRRVALGTTGK